MRISPELEWLREYLVLAEDLVPMKRIEIIKGLTPANNLRKQTCHAIISKFDDGSFHISIFKKTKDINPLTHEIKITPYTKIDILTFLSHELAHTRFFNYHCPAHKKLEVKILNRFMTRLKGNGYHSEELSE